MSDLALVASAISSIINCTVKTYDECVADGLTISPSQILDLDSIYRGSLVSFKDPILTRTSANIFTQIIRNNILQVLHPIQIFVKTLAGNSQAVFVAPNTTILELKDAIQAKLRFDISPMRLVFSGKQLNDHRTISSYNIKQGDTMHILFRMLGGFEYYVIKNEFIDPQHNFDFTYLKDDGTIYKRGNEVYHKPYGWRRIALNVEKYGFDSNRKWLGSSGDDFNEWPVSYHGTKKEVFDSIADNGYLLSKGRRFAYGKGIYSTPQIEVAELYATRFDHDGEKYRGIFQNRVNPVGLKKEDTYHGPYWITRDEKNIRPYGLCLKNVDGCTQS